MYSTRHVELKYLRTAPLVGLWTMLGQWQLWVLLTMLGHGAIIQVKVCLSHLLDYPSQIELESNCGVPGVYSLHIRWVISGKMNTLLLQVYCYYRAETASSPCLGSAVYTPQHCTYTPLRSRNNNN